MVWKYIRLILVAILRYLILFKILLEKKYEIQLVIVIVIFIGDFNPIGSGDTDSDHGFKFPKFLKFLRNMGLRHTLTFRHLSLHFYREQFWQNPIILEE